MKSAAARANIFDQCSLLYDESELQAICSRIFEHLSGKEKLKIVLDKNIEFNEADIHRIIQELQSNKPIQYILGYEWFGNLKLKVNEHVLIPRPETEELTQLLISRIKSGTYTACNIIDIGTGSGCIPVLIKKELADAELYALDVSEQALEVAKENASTHQTDINFIQADIRDETFNLQLQFDFIISNPPYILPEEKAEMHTRVFNQEPELALFVSNNDALEFYKAILFFSKKHLKKEGTVYMELNQQFGDEVKSLFESAGFECRLLKDMYGNIRFAVARK